MFQAGQSTNRGKVPMKQLFMFVLAGLLILLAYFYLYPVQRQGEQVLPGNAVVEFPATLPEDDKSVRTVIDISVHTLEGLKVLFDRAEDLAMRPQAQGQGASIVLVLHGPEVEFFAIGNYEKYKDIVDQAARLDAFDVVDVKICQTMLDARGIERDDIPSFIEQVPVGPVEIERLVRQGYVAF
jgi:intracellular sulfur oxidation DsrE/DsrF family protein